MNARDIEQALKKMGTKERAASSLWFFKTGKGEYGHGDRFFGVTVPEQRKLAKKHFEIPRSEIEKLLQSEYHECRLTGLFILVLQYQKGNRVTKKEIVNFYIKNAKRVNNWDLVDSSASYILGDYLLDTPRAILYKLVKSKNIWERRIAIVATHAFIKRGEFVDTFKIAELLLEDNHDLIHKATGWMLREVGKRVSMKTLTLFVETHGERMPRTMLRYAIEHFPKSTQKHFLLQTK